eukprot:Hpha_TRINITY_DN4814_c0_g1::TRINITY_DN4814_c0_g1_i1::g.20372::m.20372
MSEEGKSVRSVPELPTPARRYFFPGAESGGYGGYGGGYDGYGGGDLSRDESPAQSPDHATTPAQTPPRVKRRSPVGSPAGSPGPHGSPVRGRYHPSYPSSHITDPLHPSPSSLEPKRDLSGVSPLTPSPDRPDEGQDAGEWWVSNPQGVPLGVAFDPQLRLAAVRRGGPGANAGLQNALGYRLCSVNGSPPPTSDALPALLATPPGVSLRLAPTALAPPPPPPPGLPRARIPPIL